LDSGDLRRCAPHLGRRRARLPGCGREERLARLRRGRELDRDGRPHGRDRHPDDAMKIPYLDAFLKRFRKPSGAGQHDPARDWHALLVATFILILASVVWNGWFLIVTLSEETVAPEAASAEPEQDAFEKARAAYDARDAEGERYRSEYRFSDPSK